MGIDRGTSRIAARASACRISQHRPSVHCRCKKDGALFSTVSHRDRSVQRESMQITKLKAPSCKGGENPMWDVNSQRLHYIDNAGRKVHSLDPVTGTTKTLDMPSVITTL